MQNLIVIDGLDGSGKATQAGILVERLKSQGKNVRKVSFPDYDSQSSALVKMYLAGEFGTHPGDVNAYAASSFYAVDRYASFKKDWAKDWETGTIIADRYTTSNAIHQCSKLPESQWPIFLHWLFDYEYRLLGIPAPNKVIYLRMDPAVSQKLLEKRYGDMADAKKDLHEKDIEYMLRCHEAAAYCARVLGWETIECCENGAVRTKDDIAKDILDIVTTNI